MRFKVDENLPAEAIALLVANGHDALAVLDQFDAGTSDAAIASACQKEQRAILTLDAGFADIRRYPPQSFAGIIVLRLRGKGSLTRYLY